MFCSNCGAENPANQGSCIQCGQPLESIAAAAAPPPPAQPGVVSAPARHPELRTLLGVGSSHIEWGAGAAFLAASILADLVYLLLFPLFGRGGSPLYLWFISLTADLLLTAAAMAAFRWIRNDLGAAALAAAGYTLLQTASRVILLGLFVHILAPQPSFLVSQFLANFLFLLLLALAVRRIQPLWLGLWLGSTAAQLASFAVYRVGTLLSLGPRGAPSPGDVWDLAQNLVVAAVFAFAFWGGLALFAPRVLRES